MGFGAKFSHAVDLFPMPECLFSVLAKALEIQMIAISKKGSFARTILTILFRIAGLPKLRFWKF